MLLYAAHMVAHVIEMLMSGDREKKTVVIVSYFVTQRTSIGGSLVTLSPSYMLITVGSISRLIA